MVERGPAIIAMGKAVPRTVIDNDFFRKRGLDTSDPWIRRNTGIERRHMAEQGEATSDFATEAARSALAMADLEPDSISQIIVATATPDYIFPSTATIVQDNLRATRASAVDLSAACAGSIYGLAYAYTMHVAASTGLIDVKNSLVIGAETLSRIVNPDDRNTAILFGDGAGVVVVGNVTNPGVAKFVLKADGSKGNLLIVPAGGSKFPASEDTIGQGLHYIRMNGNGVFRHAVPSMVEAATEVLNNAGLTDAHGQIDQRKK